MKKLLCLCLLLTLLLVGCSAENTSPSVVPAPSETAEPSETAIETSPIPERLIGMWRSLDPGELDMVETIEFTDDGYIFVSCTYQGSDAGAIMGTYYVSGETIHCDMTSTNGDPYILDYRFEIDGRELTLRSDSKTANYIKVS